MSACSGTHTHMEPQALALNMYKHAHASARTRTRLITHSWLQPLGYTKEARVGVRGGLLLYIHVFG